MLALQSMSYQYSLRLTETQECENTESSNYM
jgi:hypothetical protein